MWIEIGGIRTNVFYQSTLLNSRKCVIQILLSITSRSERRIPRKHGRKGNINLYPVNFSYGFIGSVFYLTRYKFSSEQLGGRPSGISRKRTESFDNLLQRWFALSLVCRASGTTYSPSILCDPSSGYPRTTRVKRNLGQEKGRARR